MLKENIWWAASPPILPTGSTTLDPACFWIEEQVSVNGIFWKAILPGFCVYSIFFLQTYAKTWKSGFANYAVDANLLRLGFSIRKYAGSRVACPARGIRGEDPIKIKINSQFFFFQQKKISSLNHLKQFTNCLKILVNL